MYVSARIVRNSLLCSFIFASASAFQISNARTTEYIIPADGGKSYGNGINSTPRQTIPKNMPQGMGAAGYGRASYGWRGTITTGSTLFKQLLILEGGIIAIDWIKSQYYLPQGFDIDEQLNAYKEIKYNNYLCNINECYWKTYGDSETKFATFGEAVTAGIQNYLNSNPVNCRNNKCFVSEISINANTKNGNFKISYIVQSNGSIQNATSQTIPYYGGTEKALAIGEKSYRTEYALGEPTKNPDPEYTGAIIDQFAGISQALREALSDTVTFLSGQSRWRLTDPLGNVIKDYEGVLEPQIEPIANPHKKATPDETPKKGKVPVIEPAPIQKTTDLTTGEEAKGNTQNITNITNITNNQETADLSKIENAVTEIGADPAETPVPELELQEWGEIEIPTPEATDEQINEQAGKIRRTVTEQQVIQKAEDLIGMHSFNYETFGSSRACPPPRKMRFLTVEFDLPFDLYCDYIKQAVLLMIGLIPLGVFIYFLKNLFIHG